MTLDKLLTVLSRRPAWVVAAWLGLATAVGLGSPNLTRLAAEGQSKLLGQTSESRRRGTGKACLARAVLRIHGRAGAPSAHRPDRCRPSVRPESGRAVRVGGSSRKRTAGTGADISTPRSPTAWSARTRRSAFWSCRSIPPHVVADGSQRNWLDAIDGRRTETGKRRRSPPGAALDRDSVIGRDYMAQVQASLDRAAVATVVYAPDCLAAGLPVVFPGDGAAATIGIADHRRGPCLAEHAGWEISSLE